MRDLDRDIAAALARVVESINQRVAAARRAQASNWNRRSIGQRYRADRITHQRKETAK